MNILEAMKERHSARSNSDKGIEKDVLEIRQSKIESLNQESGLNRQLVTNEPKAFDSLLAHSGGFIGVNKILQSLGESWVLRRTIDFIRPNFRT